MVQALILAETLFYLTVSFAIIVIGVLCAIVVYHLIGIAKELEEISKNFHNASNEAGERINDIIERLSELPILSFFLKNKRSSSGDHRTKGRGKSSQN